MANKKLSILTLKEKAHLVVGHTNMTTFPIPEKGVKSKENNLNNLNMMKSMVNS